MRVSIMLYVKSTLLPSLFSKWRRNGAEHADTSEKTIANKGDFEIYEIRYRKISELFIYQYSSIFIHNSHISKLFRYVNSCISMQFHSKLVRNWCGSFEVIHFRKWVHHNTKNIINSLQLRVMRKLQAAFIYSHILSCPNSFSTSARIAFPCSKQATASMTLL